MDAVGGGSFVLGCCIHFLGPGLPPGHPAVEWLLMLKPQGPWVPRGRDTAQAGALQVSTYQVTQTQHWVGSAEKELWFQTIK